MYCKTEFAMKLKSASAFLIFCFSHIPGVINGQNDYLFITQPPSDLPCNPHSRSSNSNTSLRLECSIAVVGSTELPADTSILWYRRAPESTEEQLCGSTITKFMAASLFAEKSVGLRSIIEVRGSSSRDLLGEYWCQVAKIGLDGNTLLSNQSSILEIRTREYYRNKDLSRCEAGTIFLELILPLLSVEFSSSSPLTAENAPCPLDPILFSPECSTIDPDSISGEMDNIFTFPRMWVYILAPVIATLLIFLFLFLLIALVVTCFQRRDPKKRLASSIANIELAATSNSDSQIKSSILAGKSPSVSSFGNVHMSTTQTSTAPVPIPRHSISTGSALQRHVDLIGKQLHQHNNLQSGDEDQKSESDKEEDYIEVPPMQDRKVAKVIGMLRGACNAEHSPTAERGSNGAVNAGNFEYRSLDPDAMEPPHTYHSMQSANATTASDCPQPMYSEPGGIHGHQKVVPTKKQRPPPPLKSPPRRDGNRSKPVQHKPIQSVPSADGDYVDPNNCNSPNNSPNLQNMYQGLTLNKLEYLALYATPDSTPH